MLHPARLLPLALPLLILGCTMSPSGGNGGGPGPTQVEWGTKTTSPEQSRRGLQQFEVEPVTPGELDALRSAAIDVLMQASESTNPQLRANAIEALQAVPNQLDPVLRRALRDQNRGVRFVATMTVGDLQRSALLPDVLPLLNDPSGSVRAAAIYAMKKNNGKADPSELGSMILSENLEERGNAVLVLGKLGDPSAMPILRDALRRPAPRSSVIANRIIELQIAEAMYRLDRRLSDLQVIRAALFNQPDQGELTVMACQMIGDLGDHAPRSVLMDKAMRPGRLMEPAEIRIAAAAAVARLTPHNAPLDPILALAGSEDYRIRAQVAFALGSFRDSRSISVLATMLRDPNALVQVAAAGSVLEAGS